MEIVIKNEALQKMRAYVASVTTEISGLGRAKFDQSTGIWYVDDVKIFEQEVSGAETEMNTEMIAKFITELVRADENVEDWCVWWHSHADMGVFWSGTDTDYMNNSRAGDVLLSIVTNKKGEYKARIDIHKYGIFQDNLPLSIEMFSQEVLDEVIAEVEQKVTKKVYPVVYHGKKHKKGKFTYNQKQFKQQYDEPVVDVDRWRDIEEESEYQAKINFPIGDVKDSYTEGDMPYDVFDEEQLAELNTIAELMELKETARENFDWSGVTKCKNAIQILKNKDN